MVGREADDGFTVHQRDGRGFETALNQLQHGVLVCADILFGVPDVFLRKEPFHLIAGRSTRLAEHHYVFGHRNLPGSPLRPLYQNEQAPARLRRGLLLRPGGRAALRRSASAVAATSSIRQLSFLAFLNTSSLSSVPLAPVKLLSA